MFNLYVSTRTATGARSFHFVEKSSVSDYLANSGDDVAEGSLTINLLAENLNEDDLSWIAKEAKQACSTLRHVRLIQQATAPAGQ